MGKVGIFVVHLEHIMAFWYILWPFGNLVAIQYVFPRFGIFCQEKSGNPDLYSIKESLLDTASTIHLADTKQTKDTNCCRMGDAEFFGGKFCTEIRVRHDKQFSTCNLRI
jgi:hypothetical protein